MKSPRVYLCLLLCSYILLTGCKKGSHNPPPGPGLAPTNVTLNNCVATPDPAPIYSGDTVIFQATDSNTYLVTFLLTNTPNGPTVPVVSNPFRVGGTSISQIMRGPSNCTPNGCDYKYTLTYIINGVPQPKACADPIIHIKPTSLAGDDKH